MNYTDSDLDFCEVQETLIRLQELYLLRHGFLRKYKSPFLFWQSFVLGPPVYELSEQI